MSSISINYYSGNDSASQTGQIVPGEQSAELLVSGASYEISYSDMNLSRLVANTPSFIYLPQGACCELAYPQAVIFAGFFASNQQQKSSRQHKLETRSSLAVMSIILSFLVLYVFVYILSAPIADILAKSVPFKIKEEISNDIVEWLDIDYLEKSKLKAKRRVSINAIFEKLVLASQDKKHKYKLLFRQGNKIGANAFALPSGTVVITDELIKQAQSDSEVAGVLAHEIGHIKKNHTLRHIFRSAAAILTMSVLLNDASIISDFTYSIPAYLFTAQFSRELEYEADALSVPLLLKHGYDPEAFMRLIKRIEKSSSSSEGSNEAGSEYYSSHPHTHNRVSNVRKSIEKYKRDGKL